jgi:riboflavin-specific deaminase-like protein
VDRFLPDVGQEPLDGLYLELDLPAGTAARPYVVLGMVTSVDGAASTNGTSGGLGGEADRLAYRRLREHVDAILVGAGTVRAERYNPPAAPADRVARRRARGLADVPTLVVVSASLDLPHDLEMFADPGRRPVVVTGPAAPRERRAGLEDLADVVVVEGAPDGGSGEVDLAAALGALAGRGWTRVLCEGGPTLNAQLVAGGLADELFVTLAPRLVGDTRHRIVEGTLGRDVELELVELRHHAGELLLRYRLG